MTDIAIRCEGLGKQYQIGERERYRALRDTVTDAMSAPFRRLRSAFGGTNGAANGANNNEHGDNSFWALKDLSFEIKPGEVVGVIGRNGAGKSTLLKILSRITAPTEGEVEIRGRVGSLLEVGTGFHPELTGRENIFLNGTILGMRKAEISHKFDEIVEFAEIEKFIDTPVKRYSSGMYVRLAFAVAAHLEPEILIVDEVLAVGDIQFQKKCLGKMEDVAKHGRTVLFVSHSLAAVTRLCSAGLVLEGGKQIFNGDAEEAIDFYCRQSMRIVKDRDERFAHILYNTPSNVSEYDFAVTRIEMLDDVGNPMPAVATGEGCTLRIWYSCKSRVEDGSVLIEFYAANGSKLVVLETYQEGALPMSFEAGTHYVDCNIDRLPFAAGEYKINAGLAIPGVRLIWHQQEIATLHVLPKDIYKSGYAPVAARSLITIPHTWKAGASL